MQSVEATGPFRLRLGLASQLVGVCLAFALPLSVLLYLFVATQRGSISFGEQELRGAKVEAPLVELLGAGARLTYSKDAAARDKALASFHRALEKTESALREHGEALKFTPEELQIRKREELTPENLRALHAEVRRATSAPLYERHAAFARFNDHVRTMITHAGDTSNLILDPDLDSYYLMDASLLAIPSLVSRIGNALRGVEMKEVSSEEFIGEMSLLRANSAQAVASVTTAFTEDAQFYGESETLHAGLDEPLRNFEAATKPLEAKKARTLLTKEFEAALFALLDASTHLEEKTITEKERLIERRLADLRGHLWRGLVLSSLALALGALLAYFTARQLVSRVARLRATTDAVSRGDLSARVGTLGKDEIGDLGAAFDRMTESVALLTERDQKHAREMEAVNAGLEATVEARTKELSKRNESITLILDNVSDGLFTIDFSGNISKERSLVVETWFGDASNFIDVVRSIDARVGDNFDFLLSQVEESDLPEEVTLGQLPSELRSSERIYRLEYRVIRGPKGPERLLVIVRDETRERAALAEAERRDETLRIFQSLQNDRNGFLDFFSEGEDLVAEIRDSLLSGAPFVVRKVHTLKGTSAVFGVLSVSRHCHELETRLLEAEIDPEKEVEALAALWTRFRSEVLELTEGKQRHIEVDDVEYVALLEAIAKGTPRRELLSRIAKWKLEAAERWLARLSSQSVAIGRRLGKRIIAETVSNDVRVSPDAGASLSAALVHLVRNAVDHGIESPGERTSAGKSEEGHIAIETSRHGAEIWIEIRDDGRGIDWERVRKRARSLDLPSETEKDLVEALFSDGVSTKESITDISGRGVGTAAVRQVCRELGGEIVVISEIGKGTTFRCVLPANALERTAGFSRFPVNDSLPPRHAV